MPASTLVIGTLPLISTESVKDKLSLLNEYCKCWQMSVAFDLLRKSTQPLEGLNP